MGVVQTVVANVMLTPSTFKAVKMRNQEKSKTSYVH